MRTGRTLAVMALVALAAAPGMVLRAQRTQPNAVSSDNAEVLLQAAMHKEQVEGRLPEAIDAYKAVVAKAGSNKEVAAKALLQLAASYEKLGRPEARATYQAILRDYPDQPTAVAAARARLGATGAGRQQTDPSNPVRVIADDSAPVDRVSGDGRLALIVSNETPSRLLIRDLTTNQTRALVVGSESAGPMAPAFSPDASQVAYVWREPAARVASLMVTGTESGARPRTVLAPSSVLHIPLGWSADGKSLVVFNATLEPALTSVALADGATRTVKVFEAWRGVNQGTFIEVPRLSPDGQFVAFSAVAREGSKERHIFVVDINGGNEADVVKIAGSNTQAVWTHDGLHLFFVNEQSGRRELLSVAVRNGQAAGEPVRVKSEFVGDLLSVSVSGDLYHSRRNYAGFAELIAERNPAGARVVQTFKGMSGSWSRGNKLAFVRAGAQGDDLIIRSLDSGDERLYPHAGMSRVSPRWLRDDSAVVVWIQPEGDGGRSGGSFYLVNVHSGTFKWLFARDTAEHQRSEVSELSPDDKTLYLGVRKDSSGPWTGIVGVDLSTGAERLIVTLPGGGLRSGPGLALSPDGQTLALQGWTDTTRTHSEIFTVRTDGTDFRKVHGPFRGGGFADIMRWTPDGQSVLFVESAATSRRVMRIPASGGQAEFDGLDITNLTGSVQLPRIENIANIDISPDGSRIVFGSRTVSTYDLWKFVSPLVNGQR